MHGVLGLNAEGVGPEVGGQVLVGVSQRVEGSLDEVLGGSGVTGSLRVAIIDTSELEEFLGDGCANNAGTTRGGHELNADGSALTSYLAGHGMDSANSVTPETTSDGNELQFGVNQGALDSNLHFLGNLDAETDMTSLVTNGNNCLKAGTLSGLGLLLDGDDLHDLVGEGNLGLSRLALSNEFVNNLGLLNGNGVGVDFLEGRDEVALHQSTELGLGDPFVFGGTSGAAGGSSASVASTATESTAFSFSFGCFSHFLYCICLRL